MFIIFSGHQIHQISDHSSHLTNQSASNRSDITNPLNHLSVSVHGELPTSIAVSGLTVTADESERNVSGII